MDIDPDVFYRMEMEEFLLKRRGWNDRVVYDQLKTRKQTFIIAMSMGAKLDQLEKAWPDPLKSNKGARMVNYKGVTMTQRQMETLVKLKQKKKQEKKTDG